MRCTTAKGGGVAAYAFTMSKKKKEKKAGKASGTDQGLPPPPNLDEHAYGSVEAVLTLKIQGKENLVTQYEEETETFKQRNYKQKEQNYQLRQERATHLKNLVQKSRDHLESLDRAVPVTKEQVEQALVEKFALTRLASEDIERLEAAILDSENQLRLNSIEAEKWRNYRDKIQHERAAYVADMKARMQSMDAEMQQIEEQVAGDLQRAKEDGAKKMETLIEKQRGKISEHLQKSMDAESLGELRDNSWLQKELAVVLKKTNQLRETVSGLEQRNIQLVESLQRTLFKDLETTQKIYRASRRKGQFYSKMVSPDEGSLPSLVDTEEALSGGKVGHDEVGVLSLCGSKAPVCEPPDIFHLPPIEEQRSSHASLLGRTSWPVTSGMLRSVT